MDVIDNSWTIHALPDDDPDCLRSAEELAGYIEKVGFLPLFSNSIPGFSVEEHTAASGWWTGDPDRDPWMWREILTGSRRVAYGKFFFGNAGFVSLEWFPDFVNLRRDGYDFDALWDDEKANRKQKKIMDLFPEGADAALLTSELRQKAGFGKEGETGFDSTLTGLQMLTYLCPMDFCRRKNKAGKEYGWRIALMSTPEQIFGEELVRSRYPDDPADSLQRMCSHLEKFFPDVPGEQLERVLQGERPAAVKSKKKVPYPENLLTALELNENGHVIDCAAPTQDQLKGLSHALSQLYAKSRRVLSLRYEEYMTFREIGTDIGKTAATAGIIHKKAAQKLRHPSLSCWITEGYEGHLAQIRARTGKVLEALKERMPELDMSSFEAPVSCLLLTGGTAGRLRKAGITTVGDLYAVMLLPDWHRLLPGIGPSTSVRLQRALVQYLQMAAGQKP